MISLLDFLFLLGAGVPESGIVEADPAWVGWDGGVERWTGNGKGECLSKEVLLNLELRTSRSKISLDFQRNMYSLKQ